MALPLNYSIRNLVVRRSSTLMTAFGIAMTVAVFAGIFALREGFEQLYRPHGRTDLAIYLRPGATSEGESGFRRQSVEILTKERPEVLRNAEGRPMAAAESYLAVYMEKVGGGTTNVPIRGIQPMSIEIQGAALRLVDGRWLAFGADEVVVGRKLTTRMKDCRIGDTLVLNVTPFRVVGVFDHEGAQGGEIWGDGERMMTALERPLYQRVIARVKPDTDFARVAAELKSDPRTPVLFESERVYLGRQTTQLGGVLEFLALFLTVIMGASAVLGAIITMLASVASRTHEIGVLLAVGFRRSSVFLAFVLESALIGLGGGLLGVLIILPFDGLQTGAVNWNTFTEVSFGFRVSPEIVIRSLGLAFLLGVIGGALPALRAALLKPVDAVRQQ